MRNTTLTILTILCYVFAAQLVQANPVINEADAPKFLYTMSAKSGTYSDGRITLNDVPLVVYFSDRPQRLSGMLSIQVFAQGWNNQSPELVADPPNATLSILKDGGTDNIVVEVSEPNVKVKEGSISFKVRVLDGELPESFGTSTLFIDGLSNRPDPQITD